MVKMAQSNMGLQNNPQELRPILSRCTSLYRLVHCVGWKLGANSQTEEDWEYSPFFVGAVVRV